jgi:hypothetical protein
LVGIKTASSSFIIFQRAKLSKEVLLISGGAIEGHFVRKTPRKVNQAGFALARQCLGSPGMSNTEETGLAYLGIQYLVHDPILWIWPRRTTTCSLDRKEQLKVRHFSSNTAVIFAAEAWLSGQHYEFFFEWLAKVRVTG